MTEVQGRLTLHNSADLRTSVWLSESARDVRLGHRWTQNSPCIRNWLHTW
jgi:hypothetical protein